MQKGTCYRVYRGSCPNLAKILQTSPNKVDSCSESTAGRLTTVCSPDKHTPGMCFVITDGCCSVV